MTFNVTDNLFNVQCLNVSITFGGKSTKGWKRRNFKALLNPYKQETSPPPFKQPGESKSTEYYFQSKKNNNTIKNN